MSVKETVLIIDFDGPYNQLLTREIRNLGVFSELKPHSITMEEVTQINPKAIILSGQSEQLHTKMGREIFNLGIPVLGIDYGMELMIHHFAGKCIRRDDSNHEKKTVSIHHHSSLTDNMNHEEEVLISSHVTIENIPDGFKVNIKTAEDAVAMISDESRKLYGINFHPEAEETKSGTQLLRNFLFEISGCQGDWSAESFIEDEIANIRDVVGDKKVLCGLSGGVDSSITAALIHRAIGEQLTCIFVDHGLLRKNEAAEVMHLLADDFHMNIVQVDASEQFLSKLNGVSDPEKKRKIIGNEFINVFDEEASKLTNISFLAQGTLYSDVIESGMSVGKMVKSHHNVGGLPENMKLELIEPIRLLFKDEVRAVGTALGIPDTIVWRQPFPGPGLGIRVLGEVTKDKLEIVREADAILRDEIRQAELERSIWQYFAILPNIRSVGVGDSGRLYDHTIGIRAVHSVDGMTSDFAKIPWDVLEKISQRIVIEVAQVNRVVYDITSKPPGTIEWE